ncbi:MAG TPA: hypothetical protein VJU61_19285, partial [Polyangiaceae bacterium]|nr:hypothetical protein [Polyangiaceae bacterium]
ERLYYVTLELAAVWGRNAIVIPPDTGVAEVEFSIGATAKGRITIEKPTQLDVERLSSAAKTGIPLEDTYEYNLEVVGSHPAFRVVPVGFSPTQNQRIGEVTMTYQPAGEGGTLSVLHLVVSPVPEFAAPPGAPKKAAKPARPAPTRAVAEAEPFRPIAHYFPGTEIGQRALIMSGVHGSEPEGVRTVEFVLAALKAGRRPKFTTVVVTQIIPRTQPPGDSQKGNENDRWIGGLDPNRNFPLPGTSYATARERGRTSPGAENVYRKKDEKTGKESLAESKAKTLFPETRLLLALLERFKPHRLASVHSHHSSLNRGDSAGIFVDPRGGVSEGVGAGKPGRAPQPGDVVADPEDQRVLLDPALGAPDVELVKRMICDFESRVLDQRLDTSAFDPLTGNKIDSKTKKKTNSIHKITTIYSAAHPPGNSLGMWAPEAVAETVEGVTSPRGNRTPGILTVTVELPREKVELTKVALEQIHADVLLEVFLGCPPLPVKAAPNASAKDEAKKKADAKKKRLAKLPDVINDCPKI